MTDTMSAEQRHQCMASVHSKDTKPEMLVRRFLFSRGFRYRLHVRSLPGSPDIVLPKYKTVIFVNGCFWHGHDGCPLHRVPKSNVEFWVSKIEKNKKRDQREYSLLKKMGWKVLLVWECQLRPFCKKDTLEYLVYTLSEILLDKYRIKSYQPDIDSLESVAESVVEYGSEDIGK